jgi:hypothetical protein
MANVGARKRIWFAASYEEPIAKLTCRVGDSGAKRTASPLTPALSPLRGEGVAQHVFEKFEHHAPRRYRE